MSANSIKELYDERCRKPDSHADIWEHLPTLKNYAETVKHITEFGVRTGNSTTGFLMGLSRHGGTMRSYEIDSQQFFPPSIPSVVWTWTRTDTAQIATIDITDLLFLDSCHDTGHVLNELRFAPRVSKYILMHDTAKDWAGGDRVWKARDIFLAANPEWFLQAEWLNCNGLSVLERQIKTGKAS